MDLKRRSSRVVGLFAIAMAMALAAPVSASATLSSQPERGFATDGQVYTALVSGGTLYVGGNFLRVWESTGPGTALDRSTGLQTGSAVLAGSGAHVDTVVSDGAGGWYVGGWFTRAGTFARSDLVHLRADGAVDPAFHPNPNGAVRALALSGSTLYVAGEFTRLGGKRRQHLAAINVSTGKLVAWRPGANRTVWALAVSRGTVYAAGGFSRIGGRHRVRIAALSRRSGRATSWSPRLKGSISTLAVASRLLYVGGDFKSVGGRRRHNIAALSTKTGRATAWNPDANKNVRTLVVAGSTVYVGGFFTAIGGRPRNGLAAMDSATGKVSGPLNGPGDVKSIVLDGSILYVASGSLTPLIALDAETGRPASPVPDIAGDHVAVVAASGGSLYVGGYFSFLGGQSRQNLAAFDLRTGAPTSFDPAPWAYDYHSVNPGAVWSLAATGSTLYVGGDFANIGGKSQNALAALDATTGAPTSWSPNPPLSNGAVVDSIALDGPTLYTTAGAYDATSGAQTPWHPNANSSIDRVVPDGSTIYLAGEFTAVNGQPRNHLAAVDSTTGDPSSWNPNPNSGSFGSNIAAIAPSGSTVYVGGGFTAIGGQPRNNLAAVDAKTGNATAWNPAPDGPVYALALDGSDVEVGGSFANIAGQPHDGLAEIDGSTGVATPWAPREHVTTYTYPNVLTMAGQTLYAGFNFNCGAGKLNQGIAAFPPASPTPPPRSIDSDCNPSP